MGEEKPYCSDVTNSQLFMLPRRKENTFLNEIPDDHNFERTNDDNFVFSAKLFYQEEDNTKVLHFCLFLYKYFQDILLAFGVRNSLVHFRPCEKPALFWVSQFADFFAVADYGVIGYVPPKIKVDLRVHLTNALLGYDHSTIVANSPYQLRYGLILKKIYKKFIKGLRLALPISAHTFWKILNESSWIAFLRISIL